MKLLVIAATVLATAFAATALISWSLNGSSKRANVSAAAWILLYATAVWFRPEPMILAGLVGLAAASLAGSVAGRWIPSAQELTIFLVVASIVDLFSWLRGPTRAILEAGRTGGRSLIPYLAISVPWQGGFMPVIGISDIFGFAVILTSLRSQKVGLIEGSLVSLGALAVAVGAGVALGGVPAYPFFAAIIIPFAWTNRSIGVKRRTR